MASRADSDAIRGRFAGKVAVVTGASRGIGRATALALARQGASVVVSGRDVTALESLAGELRDTGMRAQTVVCDVSRKIEVERLAEAAYAEFSAVDFLVNNAGHYPVTPLLDMSEEEWDAVMDTNLKGPFLCSQAFARRMVSQGKGGKIVNVSSTASVVARPGTAHYGSSKAGLNQLTRVLAVELAPHGIAVNAVCPGLISTDRVQELAVRSPEEHQTKLGRIPVARLGAPEEMASAILFLLSDEASYFAGSVIFADGGYSCGIPSYSAPAGAK
jgi:NAD(P)-dependent dehydrogenase (short-subunit alcohol dehydrogenase family)